MVPKLDLYLAATMRSSDDLVARLAAFSVEPSTLSATREWARDFGFSDPRNPTMTLLEIMFGPPKAVRGEVVAYDLVLWPKHEFGWYIDSYGNASHDGFVLQQRPLSMAWVPRDPGVLRDVFEPWYHTGHEVREALGDPDQDMTWGTAWSWHYLISGGPEDVVFDFDYGLLREIRIDGASALP